MPSQNGIADVGCPGKCALRKQNGDLILTFSWVRRTDFQGARHATRLQSSNHGVIRILTRAAIEPTGVLPASALIGMRPAARGE